MANKSKNTKFWWIGIPLLTLVNLGMTIYWTLSSFAPPGPPASLDAVLPALIFPLLTIVWWLEKSLNVSIFEGGSFFLLWLFNSLCWGIIMTWLLKLIIVKAKTLKIK